MVLTLTVRWLYSGKRKAKRTRCASCAFAMIAKGVVAVTEVLEYSFARPPGRGFLFTFV